MPEFFSVSSSSPSLQASVADNTSSNMPIKSPFESSIAKPGHGEVTLSLLPPSIPTLTTLTYKYPLKLLTRTPGFVPEHSAVSAPSRPVHLYLLTYGGGLLPGDHIDVSVTLNPKTRMVVSTPQGSTKIFKTTETNANDKHHRSTRANELSDMSQQKLGVQIGSEAALCYLPDPSVPFKDSRYEQTQTFTVDGAAEGNERSSLCVLDWVTQGRTSRGENWDFELWRGKNEVWSRNKQGEKKLLLRDSVILHDEAHETYPEDGQQDAARLSEIRERTYPHGVVGTLILYGPVFDQLSSFLMHRFTSQPRIGDRNWSSSATPAESLVDSPSGDSQNVTWSASRVRAGFVVVKFGAEDFETAKHWLGDLLREEGSVQREFGEEALFSL